MSYATTSIIPFDSGRSYVVRDKDPKIRTEFRFEDHMGRTELDKKFISQFERIFLAASSGNLSTCKAVVGEGFNDFYATSVGRFGTPDGLRCDNISPYKIADMHEHEEITDFFNQCIHGTPPKVFTPKKAAVQQVSKDSYIVTVQIPLLRRGI